MSTLLEPPTEVIPLEAPAPPAALVRAEPPPRGALVLDQLVARFDAHVLMPSRHAVHASALLAALTHFRNPNGDQAGGSAPRMMFFSHEHGTGKSQAGLITALASYRPRIGGTMSGWALVKSIAERGQTPLLDNLDTKVTTKGLPELELDVVLEGFLRHTAKVGRGTKEAEEWPVFSCLIITARAGKIMVHPELNPGMTERGIVVWMKKANGTGGIEQYDFEEPDHVGPMNDVVQALGQWASDSAEEFAAHRRPELPEKCTDRRRDVWRPLFRVADLAGGPWPKRARDAYRALVLNQTADPEAGPWSRLSPAEKTVAEVRAAFKSVEEDDIRGSLTTYNLLGILEAMPGTQDCWSTDKDRVHRAAKRLRNDLAIVAEAQGLELDRESTKVPAEDGSGRYLSGWWWREVDRVTPSGLPVFGATSGLPGSDAHGDDEFPLF